MFVLHILISAMAALFLWLPIYLLGFPMVAIGLLFCDEDDEHMPRFFWLWSNPNSGINGDLGGRNPIWPRKTNGRNREYRYRWIWLAWRNPTAGFSKAVGVPITKPVQHWEYHFGDGNKLVSNRMGWAWDYAIEFRYGSTGRGLHIRVGWKLSAYKTAKPDEVPPIAARIFRVHPWRSFA
jgi:hypothetical protein